MGALYKNVCYPDSVSARQAVCSDYVARSTDGAVWSSSCTSTVFTGSTMSVELLMDGALNKSFTQAWPVTPDCDFEGGVSLAYDYFLVAITFLCIVWGGKKLLQLFDHSHADT